MSSKVCQAKGGAVHGYYLICQSDWGGFSVSVWVLLERWEKSAKDVGVGTVDSSASCLLSKNGMMTQSPSSLKDVWCSHMNQKAIKAENISGSRPIYMSALSPGSFPFQVLPKGGSEFSECWFHSPNSGTVAHTLAWVLSTQSISRNQQMMKRPVSAVGYRRPLSQHARMSMMVRPDVRYRVRRLYSCFSPLCPGGVLIYVNPLTHLQSHNLYPDTFKRDLRTATLIITIITNNMYD